VVPAGEGGGLRRLGPTARPSAPTSATPPTSLTASTWCAWFAAGLVEVRRRIQRREPRGHVRPAFEPEVFRNRFLVLRRADRLGEAEHARLEALFAAHAELARAWGMLQELHGLYLAENEEEASQALDRFARLYQDDPLPEFYKVVDTLLKWAPETFAFHRSGRWTNGRPEGTNAKLGVLKRMAFGFVNALPLRGTRPTPVPTPAHTRVAGSPRIRAVSETLDLPADPGQICASRPAHGRSTRADQDRD
jgi:Transposase